MTELSPVQRRIKDFESRNNQNNGKQFARANIDGEKAMKPSTKPNKPVQSEKKPMKAISSPAFRRSAGLSKMFAPPEASPARPTRSSRASEIRRNRLAERAVSPPPPSSASLLQRSTSPPILSPATSKTTLSSLPPPTTTTHRDSPSQQQPATPVSTVTTSSSSPSRKKLGTMVAERMRERRYVSPRATRGVEQQQQPSTPSETSTPKTTSKSVGEMVAERMKEPRTPKSDTTTLLAKSTTTKTGNTLGLMVAERMMQEQRNGGRVITSPRQQELITRIAEQKRRRDPGSNRGPTATLSPPISPTEQQEPSLGLVATERVRERRRIRRQQQQQQSEREAEESLVFSHSPPESPPSPEVRQSESVSPTKRKVVARPGIGAMVVARRKDRQLDNSTSPPISPKSIRVANRLRDQKRQHRSSSPLKKTFLVQQAMARRNPQSPKSPQDELPSMARMRRFEDTENPFPNNAFPNDPFDPFEQQQGSSPTHTFPSQFISHPTQETTPTSSRAMSHHNNHHLQLPDLTSYDQHSPTRSTTNMKDIHETQSAELQYVTDDEMTLTNVRQLVETAREATLKHPPPRQPRRKDEYYMEEQRRRHQQQHRLADPNGSFSDYDGESRGVVQPNPSGGSQLSTTPDLSSFYEHRAPRRDDDDTYDYGAREDDDDEQGSQGSLSYTERQWRREREARRAAAQAEMEGGPFMKHDDMEHYRKAVDTPLGRTAIGVAAAATAGCFVLGPVGLLLGAAAVGIGVGYMQIPEEERSNMNTKASEALNKFQESALHASDKLSHTCATTYRDSGVAEHVPDEVQNFCTNCAADIEEVKEETGSITKPESEEEEEVEDNHNIRRIITPPNKRKRDKVQCLRKGKVISISQIYRLNPPSQPRAWLDVLASAETSDSDKIEATEEVIILSKDKQMSRFFVSEGILDCLMWTIGRFLEKKHRGPGSEFWLHPEITPSEASAAKLAASCCLTLGKSYCAAMHTEGDLQLMSMYERGTVPEERQLAQLLLEVPYHRRATKTDDPTVLENEVFAMKQLSLPEAEELASVIASIATGSP